MRLLAAVERLHESNPMLGLRGVRLGLTVPGLFALQVRAVAEAAAQLVKAGGDPRPEIMVPLVGSVMELHLVRDEADAILAEVRESDGVDLHIPIGTMVELPRAALTAFRVAEAADFFSFGTNDLTQTTWGFSRDDVEAAFFAAYLDKGVFTVSPFESLDADGVGRLVDIATREGRSTRPDLKVGVCGEHGGDPESIHFFHHVRAGLRLLLALPGPGRPARGRPRRPREPLARLENGAGRGPRLCWIRRGDRGRGGTTAVVQGALGKRGAHGFTAAVAMLRLVTPRPTRTVASSGSAAASPQTPTGFPAAWPASAVMRISSRTAGCQASVRWARSVAIRSAAIVYCVRSLVPIETKSTTSRMPRRMEGGRGDLDHDAGLEAAVANLVGEGTRFGDGCDHGRHHPGLGAGLLSGQGDRVELAGEQAGVVEGQPQPAYSESRVLLIAVGGVGDRLVRAGIQGAYDDGPVGTERGEHGGVLVGLLLDCRLDRRVEEAELGAEQARPFDRRGCGRSRRLAVADIREELDADAVGGCRRTCPLVDPGAQLAVGRHPF